MTQVQSQSCEASVYIVDDDAAVRESLGWLMESEGFSVRSFENAALFLTELDEDLCGCLLLDVRMPGISGMELLQQMQGKDSLMMPVIMITGHADVPMAVRALKSGAFDFLQKPFDDEIVIELVKKAIQLNRTQRESVQLSSQWRQRFDSLTPRQQQIMQMVINGDANKMIAWQLDISMKTVEAHRAQVMRKMQLKTLSHLVQIGQQLGLSITK